MAKGLRNAALLGGAALLAAKMMGGSKDKKKRMDEQEADAAMDVISRPAMDTTGDASAGMATTDIDSFARKTQQDIDSRIPVNPRMAARRSTAAQDADAVAAAKYAAQRSRDRAAYLNRGAAETPAAAKGPSLSERFSNAMNNPDNPRIRRERLSMQDIDSNFKKGGKVKAPKSVSSASKRADGIATKGKTRGKMV
jgi:hypothetical protein